MSEQDTPSELTAILNELRRIRCSLAALNPRMKSAVGTAIDSVSEVKMSTILEVTTKHFGVTKLDILSGRRTKNITRPRQITIYLCRMLTSRSLSEIGLFLGRKDHTTIYYSVNQVINLMNKDKEFSEEIGMLADEILKAGE